MLNGGLVPLLSKGNEVNIPQPCCGYFYGNINEHADVGGVPGTVLFLFNSLTALESDCLEIGLVDW